MSPPLAPRGPSSPLNAEGWHELTLRSVRDTGTLTSMDARKGGLPMLAGKANRAQTRQEERSRMTAIYDYLLERMREREEGQALVEYALILGLVSIVSIAALTVLGGNIRTILENISSKV